MMCQKSKDHRGHGVFTAWEVVSEASVHEAEPKDFYVRLTRDVIADTVSPADMRKEWKPVDEDGTLNQNEDYPTITHTPFLAATVRSAAMA